VIGDELLATRFEADRSRLEGGRPPGPRLAEGSAPDGKPASVMAFTVSGGRIVAIDVPADPERPARLDLSALHLPGRG
jgi:hypothetical protein